MSAVILVLDVIATFECVIRLSDDMKEWKDFPATAEQDDRGTIRITSHAPLPPMRYMSIDTTAKVSS